MVSECVLGWVECHPGMASWVQAFGAIVSIIAAIMIASRQGAKMAAMAKEKDIAKFGALIGLLKHAVDTFDIHTYMANNDQKINRFRADLERLITMFESVDLFALPTSDLVATVCSVRQELVLIREMFVEDADARHHGILFKTATGKIITGILETEILKCQSGLGTYKEKA